MLSSHEAGIPGRAILAWAVTYPDPLTLLAGEAVQTGRRDEEWPGWIWCTKMDGKAGWIPESYLEIDEITQTARALRDYTAQELTIAPDERLLIDQIESGWAWVTNAAGQNGWVPLSHITARDTESDSRDDVAMPDCK